MEGGLRVDLQDPTDWLLLGHLVDDADGRDQGLAEALADLIEQPELAGDWREFVLPDLKEEFQGAVQRVQEVIAKAVAQCSEEGGSLWITREDGFLWYSTLNQARLAIEERFQFGDRDRDDLELLSDSSRQSAWYRNQFYSALQGLLLEHVLT